MHLLKHGARGNGHVHVSVDLACAQADAGHAVCYGAARMDFADVLVAHGVEIVEIAEASGIRAAPRTALQLHHLVRTFRPDVVVAHMMSSALLAFPITRVHRKPLVTVMHNSFDFHSFLMRLGDVVVAVSEAERTLLISRGYPPGKVVTIFNGAGGSPRVEGRCDDRVLARPCVMTLSGLHRRKAVGDVVTAFCDVAAEFPDWHLNVVGSGADRERLEAQVTESGLGERVHFLGSTLASKDLLAQADIFATATLADPCPLTVMEARTAGCAIVATRVGGIPETLEDGIAGRLAPVHDPGAFAVELRRLMADPTELALWRQRSLHGADYFDTGRMSKEYVALFTRLTGGRLSSRSRRRRSVG